MKILISETEVLNNQIYTFSSDFQPHMKINLLIIPIYNSADFQVYNLS